MMTQPFYVITRYQEDVSWVQDYTDNYLIYNKGEPLGGDYREVLVDNVGENQGDLIGFIHENYSDLPDTMLFVQGSPFEHCEKDIFDKLKNNKEPTFLESCPYTLEGRWKRGASKEFLEANTGWFIRELDLTKTKCSYSSYDEFMNCLFCDYVHEDWINFAPGSQYIITKELARSYQKDFWGFLKTHLLRKDTVDGHLIERALGAVVSRRFKQREL